MVQAGPTLRQASRTVRPLRALYTGNTALSTLSPAGGTFLALPGYNSMRSA